MNTSTILHIPRVGLVIGMLILVAVPATAIAQDAGAHLKAYIATLNEGVAKGDYDYAVSRQAEDGVRMHPIVGEIKGRKALRDFFAAVYKDFTDGKETITWMAAGGNRAAARILWTSVERATGKHISMPMAMFAEFDANGMIKWSEMVFDFGKAMKEAK